MSQAEDPGSGVESVAPEGPEVSQETQEKAGCGSVVPTVVPILPFKRVSPTKRIMTDLGGYSRERRPRAE